MEEGIGMISHPFLHGDFFDVLIYQYGYEKCKPCHNWGPALRNHYLFHYVISGKGTLRIQTDTRYNEYHIHGGQAFLIVPNQLIHYFADSNNPWEYIWIELDGLKAKEYIGQAGLSTNKPIYNAVSEESRDKMFQYLNHIVNNPDMPIPETMGYTYLFLNALIESSDLAHKTPKNTIQEFYIQSTFAFIDEHYMENITVDDIAAALGLSRSYFSKLVKKMTQKSPQEYLLAYRINKSCALLRTTELSIGEIALLVGYSNQFHFSRAFKNYMQQSPSEWKKKNRSMAL